MDFDLSGKVALITGGSRGIGRAVALAYARAGARVVVISRKREALEGVAEEARQAGGQALAIPAHVGHEAEIEAAVAQAVEAYGRIDILFNNAGTNPQFGPILDATASLWDKILEVNLKGTFFMCRAVAPIMKKQGAGSIINVASIAGLRPSPMLGVYSVSKAGLIMLTQVLARELGPSGIRVNALAPGVIKTDFSRALWEPDAIVSNVIALTPLGRLGEVDDVVGAALFLASPLSSYVHGAVITLDGGMSVTGGIG